MAADKINEPRALKIVLIGDGGVGKTTLLMTYHPDREGWKKYGYVPTVLDNFTTSMNYRQELFNVEFWDTEGRTNEDYEYTKFLVYPGTHAFMVCYSTVSKFSFQNASLFIADALEVCPEAGIVLVGTKTDLKAKYDDEEVTEAMAKAVCRSQVRTSSLTYDTNALKSNVEKAFKMAVQSALNPSGRMQQYYLKCSIL